MVFKLYLWRISWIFMFFHVFSWFSGFFGFFHVFSLSLWFSRIPIFSWNSRIFWQKCRLKCPFLWGAYCSNMNMEFTKTLQIYQGINAFSQSVGFLKMFGTQHYFTWESQRFHHQRCPSHTKFMAVVRSHLWYKDHSNGEKAAFDRRSSICNNRSWVTVKLQN